MVAFRHMEFNPTCSRKIIDEYPALQNIFSVVKDVVARYIILMYAKDSPMKKDYPSLQKRKEACANICKIPELDRQEVFDFVIESSELTEDGMVKTVEPNASALNALSGFLIYQNDRLWAMIVTNEQAFYEYQKKVMSEVSADEDKDMLQAIAIKTKLLEAMDDINKRLDSYYDTMTGGDKKVVESLTRKRMATPESLAK